LSLKPYPYRLPMHLGYWGFLGEFHVDLFGL
jgi:hypothetical protein